MTDHSSPVARGKAPFAPPARTPRRPPGRYDEPRPFSRPLLLALAAVLGLGLLALTFAAWQRFAPSQTVVAVVGYRVIDDHTMEVRVRVDKNPGVTVTCTVGAYDRDHVTVASELLSVSPSEEHSTVVVRSLTTSRRAATAFVSGCSP